MPYYAPFYRPNYYQQPMQGQQVQPMHENQQQFVPQYQQPPMMAQPTSDMIWVLGENEASAYLVAPGNTVTLWDKNTPTIYVKSMSAQGVPSLRILDFTERTQNAPNKAADHVCNCGDKWATKEALNGLEGKFEALQRKLDELSAVKDVKTERKAEIENG